MRVITTFAPKHWDEYAKECLASTVKHWPIPVTAYVDEIPDFEHPNLSYKLLRNCYGLQAFKEKAKTQEAALLKKTYLHEAGRFSHKVFAQFDAMESERQFFWLDADVLTLKPISEYFLRGLIEGVSLCFLGRDSYTETGFIGFNRGPEWTRFKNRYESMYLREQIFELPFWTDCHAFDEARKGMFHVRDIGQGKGLEHVWCKSPLAEYMDHLKGNRKQLGFSPEHPNASLRAIA